MSDAALPALINTERVMFCPISAEHAEDLFCIWSDPRVMEYLVADPFRSVDDALKMIDILEALPAKGEGGRWILIEKASGRVMGTLGFHNVKHEHRRAEIGYEMAPQFWGAGLMSEALSSLLTYCFCSRQFNRLEAFVNSGNDRSYAVLRRAGFVEEGTLHDYEFARGRFVDQVIFGLLRRNWGIRERHNSPTNQ